MLPSSPIWRKRTPSSYSEIATRPPSWNVGCSWNQCTEQPSAPATRLAVGVDAVAGGRDLRDRAVERGRLAGQHALGRVDGELAVVALAAPGEVLLAAGEEELVAALARPARGVHELGGLAGVEHLRVLGRAAVLGVDGDRRERPAGGEQHARPDLADVVAALGV